MKIKLLQLLIWFKNLFSKNGRKDNYFTAALKNVRKAAIKKLTTRREAKKQLMEYFRRIQRGPKKSNYELSQLAHRKGLKVDEEGNVYAPSLAMQMFNSGVKVDWRKMKFLN